MVGQRICLWFLTFLSWSSSIILALKRPSKIIPYSEISLQDTNGAVRFQYWATNESQQIPVGPIHLKNIRCHIPESRNQLLYLRSAGRSVLLLEKE